ncbi:hypothetical protein KC959_03500 [Candidatus Saccharibacteria bacterium]|nr:hypothetical protein [Candidatus Saccharibacteria bacterium]MCA9328812.1 hypothetical protein [Candidatus Saccharibacteria bacterium]
MTFTISPKKINRFHNLLNKTYGIINTIGRRIITGLPVTFLTILMVSILIIVCSVSVLSDHKQELSHVQSNCAASCHSHGQALASGTFSTNHKEDEKEPVPPTFSWPQVPFDLTLLYSLPFLSLIFVFNNRKTLLTTHLLF